MNADPKHTLSILTGSCKLPFTQILAPKSVACIKYFCRPAWGSHTTKLLHVSDVTAALIRVVQGKPKLPFSHLWDY